MNLEFFVRQKRLTRKGQTPLVGDTAGHYTFTVDFDEEWKGLAVVVVFRNGSETAQMLYEGQMLLPANVSGRGDLYVACHGYRQLGDSVAVIRTIRMTRPVRLLGSGPMAGGDPEIYTPTVFEQVMAAAGKAAQTAEELLALRDSGALSGPAGPRGEQGIPGPEGPQGMTGPQGAPGEAFVLADWLGTEADALAAISEPKPGDAYAIGAAAPYDVYIYGRTAGWVNHGKLQGAQGEPGPAGPQGPAGSAGEQGPAGETGVTFTPSVSEDGLLSWTNDGGLENPEPVNIRGPAGKDGEGGAFDESLLVDLELITLADIDAICNPLLPNTFRKVRAFQDGREYILLFGYNGAYYCLSNEAFNDWTVKAEAVPEVTSTDAQITFTTVPVLFTARASGDGFTLHNGSNNVYAYVASHGTELKINTDTGAVFTVDTSAMGGFDSDEIIPKTDNDAVWLRSQYEAGNACFKFESANTSIGIDYKDRDANYSTGFVSFILYEKIS